MTNFKKISLNFIFLNFKLYNTEIKNIYMIIYIYNYLKLCFTTPLLFLPFLLSELLLFILFFFPKGIIEFVLLHNVFSL